ncbi:MAG: hypothetical protein H6943_04460 [Zoogloeaceae bacterium]|nr:hypothetical protein [Zoogloeaceae bacterium]
MMRTLRRLILLLPLLMAAVVAHAQSCGFVPSAYPLYGYGLIVGNNTRVSNVPGGGSWNAVSTGTYTYSGINPNSGVVENALPTMPVIQPPWPTFTATNTVNLNSGTLNSQTIGTLNVTGNATIRGNFQINNLNVSANRTLTIAGGDVFVNNLSLGNGVSIVTTGQSRIFVNNSLIAGNNVTLNGGGSAAGLQFYFYDGASLTASNNLDITGLIYGGNAALNFGQNAVVTGAVVTAGTLTFGNGTDIIYDSTTQGQIGQITTCAGLIVDYRFEETSWSGANGEVIDSSGRGLNGRRLPAGAAAVQPVALPAGSVPTIAQSVAAQGLGFTVNGDFCRAASFDGSGVVEAGSSPLFDLTTQHSAMGWIYPTAQPGGGNLYSILSNDQNYEFHLDQNRKLYWWWGPNFRSNASVPLNQWTHIAITYALGQQRIYINGQLDPNSNNQTGTLNPNPCNFYVGGDVATGTCALLNARNYRGLIDEVKVFNTTLDQATIQNYMRQGRACVPPARFLISVVPVSDCAKEVTITAVDVSNNPITAYDGTIVLTTSTNHGDWSLKAGNGLFSSGLADSGKGRYSFRPISGDTGSVTLLLSNSRSETLTFNVVDSVSPPSSTNSGSQVFNPCYFNCVEKNTYVPDPAVGTGRLFTKLVGDTFQTDVVALNGIGLPNQNFNQQVRFELVDASDGAKSCDGGGVAANAWPSASGVTVGGSATPYAFTFSPAGDKGRKVLSNVLSSRAYSNLRCRITNVSTGKQSCSTDNFAIRPKTLVLTPTDSGGAAIGAGSVTAAGTDFNLSATAVANYTGTPKILADKARVSILPYTCQYSSPESVAPCGLQGAFSTDVTSGPDVIGKKNAAGSGFRFNEVGNAAIDVLGVYDDDFTTVDGGVDCRTGASAYANTFDAATGKYGCYFGNALASNLGRVKPGRFGISGANVTSTCTANGFSYMNQPLDISFMLRSLTSDGVIVTQNFDDRYIASLPAGYGIATLKAEHLDGAALVDSVARVTHPRLGTSPQAGRILKSSGSPAPAEGWELGSLSGGAVALSGALYGKAATPPLSTGALKDNDLPKNAVQFGMSVASASDAVPVNPATIGAALGVYYGRLWLNGAYGGEFLSLPIPVQTQFWTAAGWQKNLLDNCTQLTVPTSANGGLKFGPQTAGNQLAAGETVASMSGTPQGKMVNGDPGLRLSAPGAGNFGYVDIVGSQLGSPAWLPPSSDVRACFGVCGQRRSPVIYQRERY